jgi:hypothetical protein
MKHAHRSSDEAGVALFIVVVAIMVAAALSISLLMVATGHQKATLALQMREQAFAIAEAGLDRAVAEANKPANKNDPTWPLPGMVIATSPNNTVRDSNMNQIGFFTVRIIDGLLDNVDNNGDGVYTDDLANDPDEGKYARVISTGFYGKLLGNYVEPGAPVGTLARDHYQYEVALECQIFCKNVTPNVQSAVLIDDSTPDISQSGTQWTIDGHDHDMNSLADIPTAPVLPGLATTSADFGADAATIAAKSGTQILGNPAAATAPLIQANVDIDAIIEWAKNNVPASHQYKSTATSGNVNVPTSAGPFGTDPTPTTPGVFDVTYLESGGAELCLGGVATNKGAGILIVNGPLTLNGNFAFTGIIIVKGKIGLNGAGGQTLCGAVIASGTTALNLDVSGTADMIYSSAAVQAAQNLAVAYVLRSWREVRPPD